MKQRIIYDGKLFVAIKHKYELTGYYMCENTFEVLSMQMPSKPRIMKFFLNGSGKHAIELKTVDCGKKTCVIADMYMMTFKPPTNGEKVVVFKDGNYDNLSADNLVWSHSSVVYKDEAGKVIHTRRRRMTYPVHVYDLEGNYLRSFDSAAMAGDELGLSHVSIGSCAVGRCYSHAGYMFSREKKDKLVVNTTRKNKSVKQFPTGYLLNDKPVCKQDVILLTLGITYYQLRKLRLEYGNSFEYKGNKIEIIYDEIDTARK